MCVRVYVLFVVVVVIVCVCDKRSRKADAYCNSPQIVKHYYIIRGKQKKKDSMDGVERNGGSKKGNKLIM